MIITQNGEAKTVLKYFVSLLALVLFFSCQAKNKEFDYEGLTFTYSGNWKASPETIEEDWAYYVDCKKKGITSTEHVSITWVWDTEDTMPMELIENVTADYEKLFSKVSYSEFYSSTVGSFECISVDVELIYSLTSDLPFKLPIPIPATQANIYATIYAFASDEHTVVMVKIADKKEKLSNAEFQLIVDTLDIW